MSTMPVVLPISEMQRNSAALADEAMRSKEPIYLTRHGKSAVVVMDAAEFDRRMAFRDALVAREERVLAGIMQGHREIAEGHGVPLEEALAGLGADWGV